MGLRPTPESIRQGWYALASVLLFLAVGMPLMVVSLVITDGAEPGRALGVSLVALLGGVVGFVILRWRRRVG
ncbi:MAG: hypothetical protein LC808_01765 [Actinobacteria bacterium]|nr:hypothetical protein [Actinomycetota bacterium]